MIVHQAFTFGCPFTVYKFPSICINLSIVMQMCHISLYPINFLPNCHSNERWIGVIGYFGYLSIMSYLYGIRFLVAIVTIIVGHDVLIFLFLPISVDLHIHRLGLLCFVLHSRYNIFVASMKLLSWFHSFSHKNNFSLLLFIVVGFFVATCSPLLTIHIHTVTILSTNSASESVPQAIPMSSFLNVFCCQLHWTV